MMLGSIDLTLNTSFSNFAALIPPFLILVEFSTILWNFYKLTRSSTVANRKSYMLHSWFMLHLLLIFQTSAFTIYAAVDLYKTDLECVAYCCLPRYHMPKTFHDRCDGPFLHLVKQCPYIHTLVNIFEKIPRKRT